MKRKKQAGMCRYFEYFMMVGIKTGEKKFKIA